MHEAILKAAYNPVLTQIMRTLHAQSRRFWFTYERTESFADAAERHGLIVPSVSERNLKNAVAAVEALFAFLVAMTKQALEARGPQLRIGQEDNMTVSSRPGGRVLVDQLLAQAVERVTCVPGESYLAVLNALHDAQINVIVNRQEGGAAYIAGAQGKLTGRPGICFVTRGPGATNASCGVHVASQDSTPMILFIRQVGRGMQEREAFHYKLFFGGMAKWVIEIKVARLPELVARAFRVATQGRPGPGVVSLPEDMLMKEAETADAPRVVRVEYAGPRSNGRIEMI